jgi:hypothetical protein
VNQKQLVTVASRVMSLYMILWALDSISYIPIDAFSLSHYKELGFQSYSFKYDLVLIVRHLIWSTTLFAGAVWTYRCGPFIQSFLSSDDSTTAQQSPD